MLVERTIRRDEVELVWTIDRCEVIDNIFYLEHGQLVLKPEHYEMQGWPAGESEKYTPILYEIHDRGGWFYAILDQGQLVAVTVLDKRPLGPLNEHLLLDFLHVSRGYRGRGLGKRLLILSKLKALEWGGKRLYISATPSEHTVNFYLRQGCRLIPEADPRLLALEPNDIHMECLLV